jgi:stage III sporulation protein AD
VELIKIIGIGLITSIAVLVVKQVKPEIAIIITITGSLIMLLMLVEMLTSVMSVFDLLVTKTGIDKQLFSSILKIIGVGYITEFSANICSDTGNSSIADKILLSGKVIILVLALPIITALIDIVVGIMP